MSRRIIVYPAPLRLILLFLCLFLIVSCTGKKNTGQESPSDLAQTASTDKSNPPPDGADGNVQGESGNGGKNSGNGDGDKTMEDDAAFRMIIE